MHRPCLAIFPGGLMTASQTYKMTASITEREKVKRRWHVGLSSSRDLTSNLGIEWGLSDGKAEYAGVIMTSYPSPRTQNHRNKVALQKLKLYNRCLRDQSRPCKWHYSTGMRPLCLQRIFSGAVTALLTFFWHVVTSVPPTRLRKQPVRKSVLISIFILIIPVTRWCLTHFYWTTSSPPSQPDWRVN